jgi:hypothetical protein
MKAHTVNDPFITPPLIATFETVTAYHLGYSRESLAVWNFPAVPAVREVEWV